MELLIFFLLAALFVAVWRNTHKVARELYGGPYKLPPTRIRRVHVLALVLLVLVAYASTRPYVSAPGETGTTVAIRGTVACSPSLRALEAFSGWKARGDDDEAARVLEETGSVALHIGTQVKVLERAGFIERSQRVRVLTAEDKLDSDRVGRICWIPEVK